MKKGLIILICGVLLSLVSCQKEKVEIQESNDPIFTINGNFNGEEIEMIAGDNGAFMHTFTEIVNGVNLYSGSIGSASNSITIGIYDGNVDYTQVYLQDLLSTLIPQFASEGSANVSISASDFVSSQEISYLSWNVNGVDKGTSDLELTEPGKYQVCAEVHYTDLSVKTVCNEIIVGYATHANAQLNVATIQGQLTASLTPMMAGITAAEWYLNNVSIGTGQYLDAAIGSGTKELKCVIHFDNGITRVKRVLVNGTQPLKNVGDFSAAEYLNQGSYIQDYKLLVSYMKNGVNYRSDLVDNSQASMAITSIEYYGKNGNGKSVYKVGFESSLQLGTTGSTTTYPFHFQSTFGIEIE